MAVAPDGSIYASGVGNKVAGIALPAASAPAPAAAPLAVPGSTTLTIGPRPTAPPASLAASSISGGSEVYRIQSDGIRRKIWSHAQDVVYALAFDSRGRLILGTGNHGSIFRWIPIIRIHGFWTLRRRRSPASAELRTEVFMW